MSQESFIYSFVARGTMVLAEYTEFTGNFSSIATQCLLKLPSSNNKFTYNCDHHTFNFIVQDGYAYCVVAKESIGKHVSIAFLEGMKADFRKRYGGGKADTAVAKSLNKEFGPVMKEHMQYIIDHAEEIGKLLKVKNQVSEVKSIMLENIDKVFYTSACYHSFSKLKCMIPPSKHEQILTVFLLRLLKKVKHEYLVINLPFINWYVPL
ncbi:hypothetical protein GIB67_006847 [Kingdonia uniflora]|uniref:Longin domain-containing protein n=1 Tax=Kingdonia uniflora TaxID=39325 RepID=A0A7J7L006_9MAGN|nr:hypothetical protein GIB67_006847 [Kingdonia uniflora]